jgi:hypothetical protein
MSMASYIAQAARSVNKNSKVIVSDNSVVMIHNPWSYATGDYRELGKTAEYLEKLAAMYGSVHALVSGKSEKEIRKAMDDETYYVGSEIVDAGLANEFDAIAQADAAALGGTSVNSRDNLILNAQAAVVAALKKSQAAQGKDGAACRSDLEKAVATLKTSGIFAAEHSRDQPPAGVNAGGAITISLGGSMKPEDLLSQDKACYDAVFALGEKNALEKERARVNAHILLGKTVGSLDIAMKHIQSGASTSAEEVQAEYFAERLKKGQIASRNEDDPPPINTTGDSEDDKRLEAAFEAGFYGKDAGGK